jgi:hypothetical protein
MSHMSHRRITAGQQVSRSENGTLLCPTDVPHIPPQQPGHVPDVPPGTSHCPTIGPGHRPDGTCGTSSGPTSHLAVTAWPAPQPQGVGDAYTPPLSSPMAAHTGMPPGVTVAPERVTGRHPLPPIETPHGVRPCLHPATPPGSRSSWPRSAGTSCRCPRSANGPWPTARPAAPGTVCPPTSRTSAPAWPPAAGATVSALPPPTPKELPSGAP